MSVAVILNLWPMTFTTVINSSVIIKTSMAGPDSNLLTKISMYIHSGPR